MNCIALLLHILLHTKDILNSIPFSAGLGKNHACFLHLYPLDLTERPNIPFDPDNSSAGANVWWAGNLNPSKNKSYTYLTTSV